MSYDDELDMYYDKWLAAKAKAEKLVNGPGGIMEMKQTIANLEKENSELAAWQCIFHDGKTGLTSDEHGNQYCAKDTDYIHMNTPFGLLPLNSTSMRMLVDKITEQAEKITMMSAQLLIRRDRIESLKTSLAERDSYIEYRGMDDDFEEFLSK
jgi:hypothetical protein